MTTSYNATTDVLTVTGGSEGTPLTLSDLHTDDLAGTYVLLDGTIDADPDTFSLDNAVRPAEELAQKLTIACTARAGAACDIIGIDAWGNALSETGIDISSGSATTTEYFASVDANGITVNGMTNGDDFDISQGRWGIIRQYDENLYLVDCASLLIGDGSTFTYFQETRKTIYFEHAWADDSHFFRAQDNATAVFGDLDDGYGKDGCTIIVKQLQSGAEPYFAAYGGDIKLYGSYYLDITTVSRHHTRLYVRSGGHFDFTDAILEGYNRLIAYTAPTMPRVVFKNTRLGNSFYSSLSATGVRCINFSDRCITVGNNNTTITITDLEVLSCDNDIIEFASRDSQTVNLINPDASDYQYQQAGTNNTLNYKFTFDLKVVDANGDGVDTATVTMNDKDGAEIFSVSTDGNGDIVQQTITYKTITNSTGSWVETIYSPHTVTISKSGYKTRAIKYTMDRKREEIEMLETYTAVESVIAINVVEDAITGDVTEDAIIVDVTEDAIAGGVTEGAVTGEVTEEAVSGEV